MRSGRLQPTPTRHLPQRTEAPWPIRFYHKKTERHSALAGAFTPKKENAMSREGQVRGPKVIGFPSALTPQDSSESDA